MAARFSIECTGCGNCRSCPMELDIPHLLACLRRVDGGDKSALAELQLLPGDQQPKSCVGCGHCTERCPRHVDIPGCMLHLTELLTQRQEAG